MTISQEERQRIISGSEEVARPEPGRHRTPIIASLMGMLAGLGMLALMTAVLTAVGLILNLELGFVITSSDIEMASLIGLAIVAAVIVASTVTGGFVAGRIGRDGGVAAGIGSSLWLTLVLAVFAALAYWVASASNALVTFDLGDRLPSITTTDLATAASAVGGGLFVLALLGGFLGGRFGETEGNPAGRVVILREAESRPGKAQTETTENQLDHDQVSI